MKKFYALMALVCGVLLTASAKNFTVSPVEFNPSTVSRTSNHKVTAEPANISLKLNSSTFMYKANSSMFKANSRADEGWEEVGKGYFQDGIFTGMEYEVTIEKSTTDPNIYRIPDAWAAAAEYYELDGQYYPLVIDCTNPENVKIPQQNTGVIIENFASTMEIFSFSYYAEELGLDDKTFLENYGEAAITLDEDVVEIPADAIYCMFPQSDEPDTPYKTGNDDMVIALYDGYIPQWGEVAIGEINANFVIALYGAVDEAHEAYVQKNNWYDGVYRVYDPYSSLFTSEYGGSPLYIDASDPDCVYLPLQYTGIDDEDNGPTYIMSFSYFCLKNDVDILETQYADYNITLDENNKVIFPEIRKTTIEEDENGNPVKYNLIFDPIMWTWPDVDMDAQGSLSLHAYNLNADKIGTIGFVQIPDFAGISNVTVDDQVSAPVYYNIQGMEVKNPQAGQLYIVKVGNKVSKTILR